MPNRVVNLANFEQFTAINLLSDPGAIGGPKIIPSCAQISLVWGMADAKLAFNVLTGRYTGAFSGSVGQANTILTALTTGSPAAAMFAHMGSTTSLGQVTIRDLNTPDQALISSTVPGATGTDPALSLPDEMAIVITEHTALAGRANRGRIFVPNWTVATVGVGNIITPAVVSALQAWADTVQNALNSAGYQLVIGHVARKAYTGSTGTLHPARDAGSVTVSSLVVRDNHFDSQRRRGLR